MTNPVPNLLSSTLSNGASAAAVTVRDETPLLNALEDAHRQVDRILDRATDEAVSRALDEAVSRALEVGVLVTAADMLDFVMDEVGDGR